MAMKTRENVLRPQASRPCAGLPDFCYSTNITDNKVILIKLGESGYYPVYFTMGTTAEELNKSMGVTLQQQRAMEIGSMFRWDAPGADPMSYDEEGNFNFKEVEI